MHEPSVQGVSDCDSTIAPAPDVRIAFFPCERTDRHQRHRYADEDGLLIMWTDTTAGASRSEEPS